MGRVTQQIRVQKVQPDQSRTWQPDTLAVEEPLEIRLGSGPYAITMRTPGNDIELVHGFLHAENVIASRDDIVTARYCAGAVAAEQGPQNTYNIIEVQLAPGVRQPEPQRARSMSSACGVCGTASIDALLLQGRHDLAADDTTVAASVISALPDALRAEQQVFAKTGGLHAAGIFTAAGEALCVREDVGRHNAVDKVIGWAIQHERALRQTVLMVSGRSSFELVQKAYLAGIPILAAVSAPSSLAYQTAQEVGLTLAGFVRAGSFNVYSHPDRIS